MKLLSALLALSFLVTFFMEAVVFYRAIVCRQRIWQQGLVGITRTLLTRPIEIERTSLPECHTTILRDGQSARAGQVRINLNLEGKL